jgi:hypothetical protein
MRLHLPSLPAGYTRGGAIAAVQENFRQPDDAGLVDLDAGIAHRAYGDRQGDKVVADIRGIGSRHAAQIVTVRSAS